MRFKAVPVSVIVDGTLHEPALVWATDDVTEVWVWPRSEPQRIAVYPGATARTRSKEMLTGGDGTARRAMFTVELVGGDSFLVGKSKPCACGHPLKHFVPPQEVSA